MALNDTKNEYTADVEEEERQAPPTDNTKMRQKVRALGKRWLKEVIEPRNEIKSGPAKEIAEEAKNCGLSMDYIKLAIKRDEMDDLEREINDASIALVFNAYKKPMNGDLFDVIG